MTLRVMPQLGTTELCLPGPPTTMIRTLSGCPVMGARSWSSSRSIHGAQARRPKARRNSPAVLAGRRIGILDNRKPNADVLLTRLAERLAERTGATVVRTETKNAAIACEDQVLGLLAEEVDVILTGTAD